MFKLITDSGALGARTQTVRRNRTFRHAPSGRHVRVRLTRDSVSFQSRAIAEIFDPAAVKWNEAARLEPEQMAMLRGCQSRETELSPYADADSDESALLAAVAELLS